MPDGKWCFSMERSVGGCLLLYLQTTLRASLTLSIKDPTAGQCSRVDLYAVANNFGSVWELSSFYVG